MQPGNRGARSWWHGVAQEQLERGDRLAAVGRKIAIFWDIGGVKTGPTEVGEWMRGGTEVLSRASPGARPRGWFTTYLLAALDRSGPTLGRRFGRGRLGRGRFSGTRFGRGACAGFACAGTSSCVFHGNASAINGRVIYGARLKEITSSMLSWVDAGPQRGSVG